ncbi:MAG TPA: substrate-binding domain-containing protein [Micromonosporaceae bacterium]|nr:substrate-binding domain-containing protein [Micromonosporaceae bacterium]
MVLITRHRARGRRVTLSVLALVVTVGLGSMAGWLLLRDTVLSACDDSPVRLSVAAAPEITPALQQAVRQWSTPERRVDGDCVAVTVTAADPADVAATVADGFQVSLAGVGRPDGRTTVPDVWVPDSTMWLQRLRAASPSFVPGDSMPIASSPLVLAMPEPAAAALRGIDGKVTWDVLLATVTRNANLRLGIVEPGRDATGLSGLLALSGAAATARPTAGQETVAALRALAGGRSKVRDELLRRFPRASDPATLAAALTMAPLSEQAVINFNATRPPVPLISLYVDPPPAPLDYPFTFMPELDGEKRRLATALGSVLTGTSFRDGLSTQGLRSPDGTHGDGFPGGPAAPTAAQAPLQMPDIASVDRALSTWSAVTAPGRLLAVLDVSGSMKTPVPGAGGATRMQLTVAAAKRGLALFDDNWSVGYWTFSTLMAGAEDHREVVPIGPMAQQRDQLNRAVEATQPKTGGDTGLYDTTLAAYRLMQRGWAAGHVNSVVMVTDGENDDDAGISLDDLAAELKRTADPARPVQIIYIVIAARAAEPALKRVTAITGGGVFLADDPSKITEIFLKAIASRPGSPIR